MMFYDIISKYTIFFLCGFFYVSCNFIDLNQCFIGMCMMHACKCGGCHLVTYEEDLALFDVILHLLRDLVSNPIVRASKPQVVDVNFNNGLMKKIVRKNQFSTYFYN